MTIICGGDTKSRTGTGIFLMMYSHTTSTLYLSWALMGTTGAPSAVRKWGVCRLRVRGREQVVARS